MLAIAGDSLAALRTALDAHSATAPGRGAMRLALLDPTPERRVLAHKVLERGKAWRGKHDIWFSPAPLGEAGRIAFVFPGIEATFAPDIADLSRALGTDRVAAIEAALAADDLERRGFGVFTLGRLLVDALDRIGIRPDVIAGHSLGEWTAMVASEMIPPAAADELVAGLQAGSLEVPDVVFAAVGCGAAGAEAALAGLDDIAVSHDNCPHQSIVCGKRDRVRVAIARLGERGVLCQELPFRSGFHSPLFADYLAPHRRRLAQLALQRPRVEMWSATTCAPYPPDPDAIRALAIDHLVQPVRFRELVEALYSQGVRAFVQLGVGSTTGFVDDTLRGRDHLAVSAASSQPGTSQLARVAAALWVDGFSESPHAEVQKPVRSGMPLELGVPLVRLAGSVPPLSIAQAQAQPPADAANDPVLAELLATLDEAAAASRAVVDAYRAKQRPEREVTRRTLSVEAEPALLDHCFYRQPPGWPSVADRFPVVPMTMTIAMMIDAARRRAPGKVAIAVEDVRALRWLAVAPAVEIEIIARGSDRIDVEIPGYARATVVLADRYPAAPAPALPPLANTRPTPLTARTMYADRWMFHGPRYQGVSVLGPMGDDGVDGAIEVLPAPGALLDCAGQLMGWWVMHTEARDRLAMPFTIDRIAFHGADPAVGERVACGVRMREVAERHVRADLELVAHGRVWCKIDGWEDRRFDSDDPVWAVLMYPESNALAVAHDEYVDVTEHWRGAASRELMMRRYLGERERAAFDELGPRARRGWLLGRIAVKDAVRLHRWKRGMTPIWPVEIEVGNERTGQPTVAGMHVSLAHKDDRAVAIVDAERAVGIDIERIEPRTDGFIAVAYTAGELALGSGDAWLTQLWAAKEALAKAHGSGLTDPKRFEVRGREGDRLMIGDAVIETRREGDYIVAWTKL
jgi:malonyl CoA-acyl carrier protein transacylase/phosphopantetheinyl transferase